jgi:hypothetical protein
MLDENNENNYSIEYIYNDRVICLCENGSEYCFLQDSMNYYDELSFFDNTYVESRVRIWPREYCFLSPEYRDEYHRTTLFLFLENADNIPLDDNHVGFKACDLEDTVCVMVGYTGFTPDITIDAFRAERVFNNIRLTWEFPPTLEGINIAFKRFMNNTDFEGCFIAESRMHGISGHNDGYIVDSLIDSTADVASHYIYEAYIKFYNGDLRKIAECEYHGLPSDFALSAACPNPFNSTVRLVYSLSKADEGKVALEIFNVLGQKIKTLYDDLATAGEYEVAWDGTDEEGREVGSGVYIYRLTSPINSQSRKIVLLK